MPFTVEIHPSQNLAVAHCSGLVREDEIHEAVAFSFASVCLPGGLDRVIQVEPTADLRELDADTLHRIQWHVLRAGATPGLPQGFRSVLIAASPFHRPIADLYKAIWDSQDLPGVDFWVVATAAEAMAILGLPPGSDLLTRRRAVRAGETG